uniref:NHL repeat-containing protein n=1 Tax=Populus davidiana TaxID=266767 RepID=A0A6M2F844_9ROSI
MASQFSLLILILFLFNLASIHVTGDQIMLEDGYMVTTVLDGHKLNINPHAVQLRSSEIVVLDSSHSVFYTLPFPISQASLMVKRLSGEGKTGYIDGEPGLARFNKPKSFAVDLRGNVYVADQQNHAVRKISNSGVTSTIVGNYSQTGRQDGPGKTATFSSDFEVLFVPQICALLISDHGNQLVRQIDLKPEDCVIGSQSALGAVKFWVLGLSLSCLLGIVIGIATRPYVIPHEGSRPLHFSKTWKHCLINLASLVPMSCFDVRNAIASSSLYMLSKRLLWLSLSHLSLMFQINTVGPKVSNKDFISLMDSDINNPVVGKSQTFADQLKDMIDSNVHSQLSSSSSDILKLGEGGLERCDASLDVNGRINDMIQANIMGFGKLAKETTPVDFPLEGSLGLVKRR